MIHADGSVWECFMCRCYVNKWIRERRTCILENNNITGAGRYWNKLSSWRQPKENVFLYLSHKNYLGVSDCVIAIWVSLPFCSVLCLGQQFVVFYYSSLFFLGCTKADILKQTTHRTNHVIVVFLLLCMFSHLSHYRWCKILQSWCISVWFIFQYKWMKTSALRIKEMVSSPLCCYRIVKVINIVYFYLILSLTVLGRSQTNSTAFLETNRIN